jgi:hypothetical protein
MTLCRAHAGIGMLSVEALGSCVADDRGAADARRFADEQCADITILDPCLPHAGLCWSTACPAASYRPTALAGKDAEKILRKG